MSALVSRDELRSLREAFLTDFIIPGGTNAALREMLTASLGNQGSFIRGQIAYRGLISFGAPPEQATRLASAIEYFHLASLLLDDLPCMDDALTRRHAPCAHTLFGEATTILGALALINRAYGLFWSLFAGLDSRSSRSCAHITESCLGVEGILQGQALDLALRKRQLSVEEVSQVAEGKTGSLFRLALLLPAIMSGASRNELHHLGRFAELVGRIYQLLDDFVDVRSQSSHSGKSPRDRLLSSPNMVLCDSPEAAGLRLDRLLQMSSRSVALLRRRNERWEYLRDIQNALAEKRSKLLKRSSVLGPAEAA